MKIGRNKSLQLFVVKILFVVDLQSAFADDVQIQTAVFEAASQADCPQESSC